jgi:hypothetical protein
VFSPGAGFATDAPNVSSACSGAPVHDEDPIALRVFRRHNSADPMNRFAQCRLPNASLLPTTRTCTSSLLALLDGIFYGPKRPCPGADSARGIRIDTSRTLKRPLESRGPETDGDTRTGETPRLGSRAPTQPTEHFQGLCEFRISAGQAHVPGRATRWRSGVQGASVRMAVARESKTERATSPGDWTGAFSSGGPMASVPLRTCLSCLPSER